MGHGPFVVLFEQDGADQPHDRCLVGVNADDVGAALDLLVEPLERVGGVQLAAQLLGAIHEGEDIVFGLVHHGCKILKAFVQAVGEVATLFTGGADVWVGEGGADGGGSHWLRSSSPPIPPR